MSGSVVRTRKIEDLKPGDKFAFKGTVTTVEMVEVQQPHGNHVHINRAQCFDTGTLVTLLK